MLISKRSKRSPSAHQLPSASVARHAPRPAHLGTATIIVHVPAVWFRHACSLSQLGWFHILFLRCIHRGEYMMALLVAIRSTGMPREIVCSFELCA